MALTHNSSDESQHWRPPEVKIIGDRAVRYCDVCVHEISMGDVEDPDLMIAQPIWEWQQSDAGKFVMEHAVEAPYWARSMDYSSWGHKYRIVARLSEQNETYFRLRFQK